MSSHHNGDFSDIASSKYLTTKFLVDTKGVKIRFGPSGYLKVKGQDENSAITAVKKQLGSHYREDGPPLAIEFDPLPPGAFESSEQEQNNVWCLVQFKFGYSRRGQRAHDFCTSNASD
ncbi:unnamed protein product [Fraxinus pennsylvanica]|uniref:Uncharacterized protein n=1 Tax=Fraxinus pennsylvanica TaxID=56036 RepID=A0AAD1Z9H6_9LAMI|nr:unnamed protein product [Fraxinus pennsylvanica]